MKIYTKTGDQGETKLLYGDTVPKDSLAPEAYGSVDELLWEHEVVVAKRSQRFPLQLFTHCFTN